MKSISKKYRQRQRRVCIILRSLFNFNFQKFDNRGLMVMKEEMNHWKQLSIQYMTEESDGNDADTLIVHELQWRSQSMHYYCGKCNNYYFT